MAKRWAVRSLIAETGFLFLAVLFSFWFLVGAAAAGFVAFGLGVYISVAHKNHSWLLVPFVAISIPIWAIWSTIMGLNPG
jgi:hypothetical protein